MIYKIRSVTDLMVNEKVDEESMIRKNRVYSGMVAVEGRGAVLESYADQKLTVTSRVEHISVIDNEITLETMNSIYIIAIQEGEAESGEDNSMATRNESTER